MKQSQTFAKVLAYEANEIGQDEAIAMFQQWVDSGEIWQLPDDYLDVAARLIEHGVLNTKENSDVH